MPSVIMLLTTQGSNWLVIVLKCQKTDFLNVLHKTWGIVKTETNLARSIPHYSIRNGDTRFVTISFRILREFSEETAEGIVEFIESQMSNYECEIHLTGGFFDQYQKWIPKGELNKDWDYQNCLTLHELSQLILNVIQRYQFRGSGTMQGEHIIHFVCNMMGLIEKCRYYDDIFGGLTLHLNRTTNES